MVHAIIGRSASGKSTIEIEVSKTLDFLNRIIHDTTRLARETEKHGVDYYFITRDQFKKQLGDYVAYSCFNGWYYGINERRIDLMRHNICVVSPREFYKLKAKYGDFVKGYVIHSEDKERLLRSLNREEKPNCYECCRRYMADEEDFAEIEKDTSLHHFDNNGKLSDVVEEVANAIIQEIRKRELMYVDIKRGA